MKRDWTAGPIAVALIAALVAAGAVWVMWTADPVLTLLAGIWAAMTGLCVLAATRNLRARLENAERLLDAWNSSEARDELAKSPPAGTLVVSQAVLDAMPKAEAEVFGAPLGNVFGMPVKASPFVPEGTAYVVDDRPYDWATEQPMEPRHVGAGPGDVGHLTVREGATGWLGPEDVTFERPAEPVAERVQAIIDHHLPTVAPMTVAETDRLVAQLQALPGEDVSTPDPAPLPVAAWDRHLTVTAFGELPPDHPRLQDAPWVAWHLGQPCARCDAPSTAWVSDRPDPEISDVTFLCDGCYGDRMSEEDGR